MRWIPKFIKRVRFLFFSNYFLNYLSTVVVQGTETEFEYQKHSFCVDFYVLSKNVIENRKFQAQPPASKSRSKVTWPVRSGSQAEIQI